MSTWLLSYRQRVGLFKWYQSENISKKFLVQDGEKTSWHRYATTLTTLTICLRTFILEDIHTSCQYSTDLHKKSFLTRSLYTFVKWNSFLIVFTARCYASAVLVMTLCLSVRLSVCPSVCPSQVGVLLKRLNVRSHKQHHTIAQGV